MRRALGSVTQVKGKKGVYRIRVERDRDPVTRNRRWTDHTFRGTRKDAEEELDRILELAGLVAPSGNVTLKEYLDKRYIPYCDSRIGSGLRKTTVEGYKSKIAVHINPRIGHLRLQKVTRHTIDTWTAQMVSDGVKPQTAAHAYSVLRHALRQAVAWDMIEKDPSAGTHAPKVSCCEIIVLDLDQFNAMLDAFSGTRLELAVSLALGLGIRRSEVCGLDWKDIELTAPVKKELPEQDIPAQAIVYIRRGRHQVGSEDWYSEPKSKKSHRVLIAPAFLADVLWKARGIGPVVPMKPDQLRRAYQHDMKALNLPWIPLRYLRNTHCTLMSEAGADAKSIADHSGHDTSEVTERRYIRPRLIIEEPYAAKVQTLRRPHNHPTSARDKQVSAGME